MTSTDSTSVRRQLRVHAPIERAFAVFVEKFGQFKPVEHNLMAVPIAQTVFEPRVGGHLYDRGTDGTECRWSRILVFEPPHRVVFSWDIGPTWQIEHDPARCSEVEVRFVADEPDITRVELHHRHLERHGPGWESVRGALMGDDGWPLYLDRYATIVVGDL